MKRTKSALRVLGTKTHSDAASASIEEAVRVRKIQSLPQFFGSGIWEGDLSEMREDRNPTSRRPR